MAPVEITIRKIKYVVVEEHTLCYVFAEQPQLGMILEASTLRAKLYGRAKTGSPFNRDGSGPLNLPDFAGRVRMASTKDFEVFGHSCEGILRDPACLLAKNPEVDEAYDASNW